MANLFVFILQICIDVFIKTAYYVLCQTIYSKGGDSVLENMSERHLGLEVKILSNAIKRFAESDATRTASCRATSNNSWIIGFIAHCTQEGKSVYQRDLESHFGITRSTASKVIDLMVQKDLIIRKTVMDDARIRKLELSDRAWQIADQMRQDAVHMEQILTQNIPAEDLNVVFR